MDDKNLVGGGNCVKIAPEEIVHYVKFIEKLALKVEERDYINKQIKQDILLINMKAHNLMEDRNNNLEEET